MGCLFMQAKISIQLIAPDSHVTWSVFLFLPSNYSSYIHTIEIQTEQVKISRLKEPESVYYSADEIPNCLQSIHLITSRPL